jgi:hypothetical protein
MYEEERKGVYRSSYLFLNRVLLLALNELLPKPNNAFVKLFASRQQEREAAYAALDASVLEESPRLHTYLVGLKRVLDVKGDVGMAKTLTKEEVIEIGEMVCQRVLEMATPEERLFGLGAEERLAGLGPKERLAGMNAEERRNLLRLLQEELDDTGGDKASGNGDTP